LQARDNDGDGLREAVQDIQGNRIDANHDGIQDADQHNVTAIHLINDGSMHGDFGAISVNSQYQLTNAILTKHDSALSLSHPIETVNAFNGTVSFAVLGIPTGGSIDAIISLPESLSSDHNQKYFAFNYITQRYEHYADSNGSPLYQFTDSDYDKIPASVALTLTDGNPLWDGDGITNGTVICKGFLGRDNVEGTSRSIVNAATAGPPPPSPINAIAINQESDGLDSNIPTGSVSARCFYGQEGTDIITGHKGHDLFIYQSISESQADLSDTVKFGRRDRFVLSSIDGNGLQEGMQSLSFVDEQAFSNHPGELRASASILEADTDGDGLADFKINLRSDHLINSNNLIL